MPTSRIPGFYRLDPKQRQEAIEEVADLHTDEVLALNSEALSLESANLMIENVIGTMALPIGVGVNFLINDQDVVVPMVVEEPSVVAAVSNMARLVRLSGGFRAEADPSIMIGQILVYDADPDAVSRIVQHQDELMTEASAIHPRLVERGGGMVDLTARRVRYEEPGQPPEDFMVVEFGVDCVDAMGANMVNTVAERLAPRVAAISNGSIGMRILSNLASRRLARATCRVKAEFLGTPEVPGNIVAEGIARATRFAHADPWRAATHNKGVMNGIDAVAIATGNDWRAIEAGAHAWASRDGQYRSMTRWFLDDGFLVGSIEVPLQVGTVGGPIRNHPTVQSNLKILGNPRARELSGVMAAVGLAQNLGALRALATEGIQKGHMRMHARNVAVQAGAGADEIEAVVEALCLAQDYSVDAATKALEALRG